MFKNFFAFIGVVVCGKYAWDLTNRLIEFRATQRADEILRRRGAQPSV